MKIGSRIKELRTNRGLTQEALADAMGVTPQTVSKWECEVNFPDVSLLPDLSVFFGVSIDSLFSMTRADKFERIENRLAEAGMLAEDEMKQIEAILLESASDPEAKGEATVLLARLYNHQARACSKVAAAYARTASEVTDGSAESMRELAEATRSAPFGAVEGSHRDVIVYLKGYLGRNPYSADATALLIDNLIADSRIEEAKMWCDHLAKIEDSARTLAYKYKVMASSGDEDVALAAVAVIESVYSNDPDACMILADIYIGRAEYKKAFDACRRAAGKYPVPRPVAPFTVAAHVSELLGDIDGATSCLRDALKVLKDEWGVVSGERVDTIRTELKKISSAE